MIKIKDVADANSAEIYINGEIIDNNDAEMLKFCYNDDDMPEYSWPADLRRQLDALAGKDITVYINSPGGSVFAGAAMADFLARHDGMTTAVVEGWCCSIATEIFFACQERKIPANAYLMIHKPSMVASGTADELLKAAETLDTIQDGIEALYRKAALDDVTEDQIHDMVNSETWLTGTDAANYFNVEVLDAEKMAACANDANVKFVNMPKDIKFQALKPEEPEEPEEEKVNDSAGSEREKAEKDKKIKAYIRATLAVAEAEEAKLK